MNEKYSLKEASLLKKAKRLIASSITSNTSPNVEGIQPFKRKRALYRAYERRDLKAKLIIAKIIKASK